MRENAACSAKTPASPPQSRPYQSRIPLANGQCRKKQENPLGAGRVGAKGFGGLSMLAYWPGLKVPTSDHHAHGHHGQNKEDDQNDHVRHVSPHEVQEVSATHDKRRP
jgi:hypothetical protein